MMLDDIRYKLVTEEELREMVIEDYVNECYYNTYYIKIVNGMFEIHDQPIEECYRLEILPGFWAEQYREYCCQSADDYYEDRNVTEEEILDLADRTEEDKDQYRDYISLARDHLDIDHETKTIVF